MKPKHPVQIEIETKIRSQHKEQSTADAYWGWVKRYFEFCLKNKLGKGATAAKSPLESLLANPQAVVEHRKSEEKPTLRVFAG